MAHFTLTAIGSSYPRKKDHFYMRLHGNHIGIAIRKVASQWEMRIVNFTLNLSKSIMGSCFLTFVMDEMFMSHQNSSAETLILIVIVIRGGAFCRWLGHKGGTLKNETSPLIKETPENFLSFSAMWGNTDKRAVYESGSKFSPDTESTSLLTLEFPPSRTMRNKLPVVYMHIVYHIQL